MKGPRHPALLFMGVGLELLVVVLAGVYLGGMLDQRLGTSGIAMAGLTFFLFVVWLVKFIFMLKKLNDQMNKDSE